MSQFFTTADAILDHLLTIPALEGIPMLVDRQKDIASELRKAISKQTGCLLLITWTGSKNDDLSGDGPRFVSTYSVALLSKPIIRTGETAADDIMDAVAVALHDFRPNNSFYDRLVVTGIVPVFNEELLIYRLDLTTPNQL